MSYDERREKALERLKANEPREAFTHLRATLEYPGDALEGPRWRESIELLSKIAHGLGADALARAASIAADEDAAPDALYTLGFELIEQSLPGIAATVLRKAHALAPDDPQILAELSSALESADLHGEAVRMLSAQTALVDGEFVIRYLLAYNTMMIGDRRGVRALMPRLGELLASDPEESYRFMRDQLEHMLARAEAIERVSALDGDDLRGWHYAINGALLLHLSPHGFAEGMRGRYAYIHDSIGLMKEGLDRLRAVLGAWGALPERIFVLPEVNSEALGRAAAKMFGVPAVPWPKGGATDPGLTIAYDLCDLESDVLESLFEHRRRQVLFAHTSPWTEEPPFAADITTLLYQMRVPATDATAEAILTAKIEVGALADLPSLIALAETISTARGIASAGAFQDRGRRSRQRPDSPVKSSRFL